MQFSVFSLTLHPNFITFSEPTIPLIKRGANPKRMNPNFRSTHKELLSAIHPIIVEKGLKATTMDLVAQRLGMSKRTLYEIFDSKTSMIKEVLANHGESQRKKICEIIDTAPNVMVALIRIFEIHRKDMEGMNVSFFRDMDRLYPELRDNYEKRHEMHREGIESLYRKGVGQGVFRDDINFLILDRMMEIQAESLKRMEELFPPEITLVEIYDTMTLGFLRSIASGKGHELLDEYLVNKNSDSHPARRGPEDSRN